VRGDLRVARNNNKNSSISISISSLEAAAEPHAVHHKAAGVCSLTRWPVASQLALGGRW
jgi:hypothetical protein